MSPEDTAIRHLLLRLGATPNYAGFRYAVHALSLSIKQDERLTHVSKYLYPDIASRYHTTYMAVERDIRTLISVIWRSNPQLMHEIAGHELKRKPTVAQFLSILTVYLSIPHHRDESPEKSAVSAASLSGISAAASTGCQ